MATKKKTKRAAAPPESVDELQARVAAKLARKVVTVRNMVDGARGAAVDGRDVIRRGVLEALDDYLGEDEQ